MSLTKTNAKTKICKNPKCYAEMHTRTKKCPTCGFVQYVEDKQRVTRSNGMPKQKKTSKKQRKIDALENFSSDPSRVTSDSLSIYQVIKMIDNGQLLLEPPIQRQKGQWTPKMRSKYLTTIFNMSNGVTSVVSRKVRDHGLTHQECMDGSNRLYSIYEFYKGNIKFSSKNEYIIDSNATKYDVCELKFDDLPNDLQEVFRSSKIYFSTLSEDIPLAEVAELFHNLQSGIRLTTTEILKTSHSSNANYLRNTTYSHSLFKDIIKDSKKKSGVSDLWTFETASLILCYCSKHVNYKGSDINNAYQLTGKQVVEFYLKDDLTTDVKNMSERVCDILHSVLSYENKDLTKQNLKNFDLRMLICVICKLLMSNYSITKDQHETIFRLFNEKKGHVASRSGKNTMPKYSKELENEIIKKLGLKPIAF